MVDETNVGPASNGGDDQPVPEAGPVSDESVAPPQESSPSPHFEMAADTPTTLVPFKIVVLMVLGMCLVTIVQDGIESGTMPCILTTLEEELGASTTAITVAYSMTDVAKVFMAPLVGYAGASEHKPVFVAAGVLVWCAGCLAFGFANHVAWLGVGSFVMGVSYTFMTTLRAPILDDVFPHKIDKHRVPHHVGVVASNVPLGVAIGFVVCAGTLSTWRYNFYLATPLIALGAALMTKAHNLNLPLLIAYHEEHPEQGQKSHLASKVASPRHGSALPSPSGSEPFAQVQPCPVPAESLVKAKAPEPSQMTEGEAHETGEEDVHYPHLPGTDSPTTMQHHSTRVEEREGVHNLTTFAAALKGDDVERPKFWPLMKVVLRNPVFVGNILNQTATMMYVTAYAALTPKFLEDHLGQSKSTASLTMGALVPAVALGVLLGGIWVRRQKYDLRQLLKFMLITNILSSPAIVFLWFIPSFPVLIVVVVVTMLVVSFRTAPAMATFQPAAAAYHYQLDGKMPDGATLPLSALVGMSNGASAGLIRVGGSIPGPILLAVFIDFALDSLSYPGAFAIVGAIGCTFGLLGAVIAYVNCPSDEVLAALKGSPMLDDEGGVPAVVVTHDVDASSE